MKEEKKVQSDAELGGESLADEQSELAGFDGGDGEVANLREQLAEMKDKHLRIAAELENLRRRSEKERSDLLKFANESIITELLPVLDSFEQAIGELASHQDGDSQDPVREGIRMIHKQFVAVMQKSGVEEVAAVDSDFDPNCHQAVQMIPSDEVDSEKVKDVYAKGYTLNGRLVRPAMVSVLVPK